MWLGEVVVILLAMFPHDGNFWRDGKRSVGVPGGCVLFLSKHQKEHY